MTSMRVVHTVAEVREWRASIRGSESTVGLVPTMGALHRGHTALIEASRRDNAHTVVTIFVNPRQFMPWEDYERYPRPIEKDLALCSEAGVSLVFQPEVSEMFPPRFSTTVDLEVLTRTLCGAKRPGHFRGVTTVATKLFNIVQPDRVYFAQKDAQQARIVEQLAKDLNVEIEVLICPTVRDNDGLALSSRIAGLSPSQRVVAQVLNRGLRKVEAAYHRGESDARVLRDMALATINSEPSAYVDYLEIVSYKSLEPLVTVDQEALAAVSIRLGQLRLMDNVLLSYPPDPKVVEGQEVDGNGKSGSKSGKKKPSK